MILGIWLTLDPARASNWNLGERWLGALGQADWLTLVPFGLLVSVLLIVGSGKSRAVH